MTIGDQSLLAAMRNRLLPKVIAGLLATSVLTLVVSLVTGVTAGELRGQLTFGLLVGSVLNAFAIGMAIRTPDVVFNFVQWSWLTFTMLVLAVAMALGANGGDIVLTYAMLALAFPASVAATPLVGSLLNDATQETAGLFVYWSILFISGYVQWFMVIGPLFRNGRSSKSTTTPDS